MTTLTIGPIFPGAPGFPSLPGNPFSPEDPDGPCLPGSPWENISQWKTAISITRVASYIHDLQDRHPPPACHEPPVLPILRVVT